jgi:hypothetical protein
MKLKIVLVAIALAFMLYVASPFATAWLIREAIRNDHPAFLSYAVDWPSVRETLKPSLATLVLAHHGTDESSPEGAGLWQRLKEKWGASAVDHLVDMYVTPDGLPKLFRLGQTYRHYAGKDSDGTAQPSLLERIRQGWARIHRAEFTGPATFEIDVADKRDPNRVYLGKLKLTPLGWKLTELRIKFLPTAKNTATQQFTSASLLPWGEGGRRPDEGTVSNPYPVIPAEAQRRAGTQDRA